MNAELAVPDVHGDVLDLAGKGDTGVVEQDVRPSVRRHHRVHDLGPVVFRCHNEVQVTRVMALGTEGGRGALAQVVADVGQHHLGALAHEQMRRRAAEAHQLALDRSRRAGQQRHLALESHLLSPASSLIGGRMRYFVSCLHRWTVGRVEAALALTLFGNYHRAFCHPDRAWAGV
jgi:hypothetical protein